MQRLLLRPASYPFGKGKATALKTLLAGDYHGLANVLGEVGATTEDLRRDEGSTKNEELNDPDEQNLDENTDDDEDIEDEPTESYFMDDEWQ